MKEKINIHNCTLAELESLCARYGEKRYRARQLFMWIYKKNITSWDEASDISCGLREKIQDDCSLFSLTITHVFTSKKGDSIKYLFKTHDKHFVEAVLIKAEKRKTVCLSTQIGCKYGCSFCASGKGGFMRNLTCAEIVDQLLLIQHHSHEKITNVVFMGMGEPLDNYDNTIKAITLLMHQEGIGLGARRITISTVGLVPAIERFAREGFSRIRLSVSVHAAFDEKRKKILPIAHTYSLQKLIAVLKKVREQFKRDITIEYVLIKGFNDLQDDAHALAAIAKDVKAKVNLIGYNGVEGLPFNTPTEKEIMQFREKLEKKNIRTTVRYSAGSDIAAACGQLRFLK